MEKTYSKDDIINLINRNKEKGLLITNSTVDQIMEDIDYQETPLVLSTSIMPDIKHSSFQGLLNKRFNFNSLFNCTTMWGLTQNIINISKECGSYGYIPYSEESNIGYLKMLGDLFEIFAEIFFKLTSSDNRVGIRNYTPIKDIEDYGVDGVGVAMNKSPATVQVKFRTNPINTLTIKDLKNFQGLSYSKYNVPVDLKQNLIIFTNCSGIHWNTETKVLNNTTITYGVFGESSDYNLKGLLDNNLSFWKNLNEMLVYNVDKIINTYG